MDGGVLEVFFLMVSPVCRRADETTRLAHLERFLMETQVSIPGFLQALFKGLG